MKRPTFALLTVVAAFGIGGAVFADNHNDAATLNQISRYREWTRVNPNPVEVLVPVTRTAGAVSIDALS